LQKRVKRIRKFVETDLWQPIDSFPRVKRILFRIIRVIYIASVGSISNKNSLRSSALTFYSALSIVPVFAVAFGIAQGFGFEDKLETQIRETFAGQEEVMAKVIEFSRSSLENVSGGLVAGISILFLLWSVIKLLNHIENAFNKIWNIKKPRSFIRKFTEYLAIILVGPIFILLSSSTTVFISTQLKSLQEEGTLFDLTSGFLLSLVQLAPFILLWILFTLLYIIIPNRNVKFLPALIAGIVAGTAFEFLQSGYVYFQVAMSRYNAIYGSFAALPLFLIWLQISWLIILFGAEISHAVQYSRQFINAEETKNLSFRTLKTICLNVLQKVAENFRKGEASKPSALADELNLPMAYIEVSFNSLLKASLISKVDGNGSEPAYQPSTALENLKLASIITQLENNGKSDLRFVKSKEYKRVEKHLNMLDAQLEKSDLNKGII